MPAGNASPYLISFDPVGSRELGYISIAEEHRLPFSVKRVYWTYFTPQAVERGNHAHKQLEQVVIAASGTIEVETENTRGECKKFVLDDPSKGVYIPPMHWRKIRFSDGAVLLCLASTIYEAGDYIRDYNEFKQAGA